VRRAHPHDRRSAIVRLTADAQRIVADAVAEQVAELYSLMSVLSDAEAAAVSNSCAA
jgi:DNA-binding MarR family transcriptional regulator